MATGQELLSLLFARYLPGESVGWEETSQPRNNSGGCAGRASAGREKAPGSEPSGERQQELKGAAKTTWLDFWLPPKMQKSGRSVITALKICFIVT